MNGYGLLWIYRLKVVIYRTKRSWLPNRINRFCRFTDFLTVLLISLPFYWFPYRFTDFLTVLPFCDSMDQILHSFAKTDTSVQWQTMTFHKTVRKHRRRVSFFIKFIKMRCTISATLLKQDLAHKHTSLTGNVNTKCIFRHPIGSADIQSLFSSNRLGYTAKPRKHG